MLGEFVDDYTVRVVDVFAMPQSGTGVSVEAVDSVFQTKMMEMLRQTGRWVARPKAIRANRPKTRNRSRLVPLAPRLWLLALVGRHQHAAVLRAADAARRGRRRGPHPVGEGQGRY